MMRRTTVTTPFGRFTGFEGDAITRQLMVFGAHQRSDLAMVLSLTRPGDWVVDVGAHIGTFAVPMARAVGPTGRVFAFEAVPEHFELLCLNCMQNDVSDIVVPVNAIVTRGLSDLRMTRPPANTGASSFLQSSGEELTGVRQIGLDAWWQDIGGRGRTIALVKVDVEGMEYDVLRSADALLASERPAVVFEVVKGWSTFKAAMFPELPRQAAISDSWAALARLFDASGYHLFVNLHARNGADDRFRLGRLGGLTSRHLVGNRMADVLAVPAGSSRYPEEPASRLLTQALFLARGARQAAQAAPAHATRGVRRPRRALELLRRGLQGPS